MHEMTDVEHWDANWATKPSAKLPSGLVVGTRNLQRLLRRHIKPGMQVLEAGCAPGKMLAWVNRALGAKVAGLDYSPRGAEVTRWLLGELHVQGDIRCESIFSTSFGPATFDVVYS